MCLYYCINTFVILYLRLSSNIYKTIQFYDQLPITINKFLMTDDQLLFMTNCVKLNYQSTITNDQVPMTKYQWPRDNGWLPLTIANGLLPITNCKLLMTKWPKNISISSQFSYELDSIELHSCFLLLKTLNSKYLFIKAMQQTYVLLLNSLQL